jgi:predicted ATPase
VRLITLTGPGGVGKTRVALEAATRLANDFAAGVAMVTLAAVSDPDLVASTVAHALGLREASGVNPIEQLSDALWDLHLLLLLDNFEQVVTAAPVIAELLAACPRLTVLVTSRALLRVRGEQEIALSPLALPSLKHLPPLDTLAQVASVALFVRCARTVHPHFRLTDTNAATVARICHCLDGLPLAIELAAARIRLFSPQALLMRLENIFQVLTGGPRDLPVRQQTLRATIAWSYDLLTSQEQCLYARLGVFVGGFTLAAATAVATESTSLCDALVDARDPAAAEIVILDLLGSLMEQSLLHRLAPDGDEPRFGMLELMREYALEQLQAHDSISPIRCRHALFLLELVNQAEPRLWGPEQERWLRRLDSDYDNLRAALAWSLESPDGEPELSGSSTRLSPVEIGMRIAERLWHFWAVRGYYADGRKWIETVLTRRGTMTSSVLAGALSIGGKLAELQGDPA